MTREKADDERADGFEFAIIAAARFEPMSLEMDGRSKSRRRFGKGDDPTAFLNVIPVFISAG
ncbi:hypothetical protein WG901_21595 [Novosphingobium sp. PS1R-30]|uniref:Transposase n=1 Tax=Novosphingobium anseongense TaxID=3133436 RepID=A0ABU8S1N9_9SPHN